jgi:hypothetical protein
MSTSPTPSGEAATRPLDAKREERLRDILVGFAIGSPSGHVAVLRDDVTAMLGEIALLRIERLLLAKLAAETPQFFNPLVVYEVEGLRDRLLAEEAARVR